MIKKETGASSDFWDLRMDYRHTKKGKMKPSKNGSSNQQAFFFFWFSAESSADSIDDVINDIMSDNGYDPVLKPVSTWFWIST